MNTDKQTFRLLIAEQIIEVHSLYHKCRELCIDYLCTDNNESVRPNIIVDIVPRNIMRENDASQKAHGDSSNNTYLYYDPGYLECFAVHRKICEAMPKFGAFLMHGAVVAYNDHAYMFTAPSGVGKSTRVKLWLQEYPNAFIINGDKPFLKVLDHSVIAYGSPWCGKEHWNTNIGLPLQAIFILERAAGEEENSLQELSLEQAYPAILKQTYQPRNQKALVDTLRLLCNLEGKVRLFQLKSKPTKEGIRLAYEGAQPRQIR